MHVQSSHALGMREAGKWQCERTRIGVAFDLYAKVGRRLGQQSDAHILIDTICVDDERSQWRAASIKERECCRRSLYTQGPEKKVCRFGVERELRCTAQREFARFLFAERKRRN